MGIMRKVFGTPNPKEWGGSAGTLSSMQWDVHRPAPSLSGVGPSGEALQPAKKPQRLSNLGPSGEASFSPAEQQARSARRMDRFGTALLIGAGIAEALSSGGGGGGGGGGGSVGGGGGGGGGGSDDDYYDYSDLAYEGYDGPDGDYGASGVA